MSVSSQASCSTSSTYPVPLTPDRDSSSRFLPDFSPDIILSPKTPESLRQYASALKASMAAGLSNAMKELKDDRGGPERAFDVQYGYDEDPIERHVKLFLTPRIALAPELDRPQARSSSIARSISPSGLEVLLDDLQPKDSDSTALVEEQPPFRPGLINFHRSFPSSIPSLSRSTSLSSPFDRDRMSGTDTPNSSISYTSESSFEALAPDDDHHHHHHHVRRPEEDVFIDLGDRLNFSPEMQTKPSKRISTLSNAESISTVVLDHPASLQATPEPKRKIRIRTTWHNARRSTPASESQGSTSRQSENPPAKKERRSLFSRPSLLRPKVRPPSRPSTTVEPCASNSIGMRQERPFEDTIGVASGMVEGEDDDWLQGRSISETMIVVAGLQSQRGRGINLDL